MLDDQSTIPVIDIFAGPGGLSEGFNSTARMGRRLSFSSVLSIEKDAVACATLRLRSFFHQFASQRIPEAYYRVIRGEAPLTELSKFPEWAKAEQLVWNAELGRVPPAELHSRIKETLSGRQDWVLLGGPPCQAYSLVGRARMTGVGHVAKVTQAEGGTIASLRLDRLTKFAKDVRHTLYKEYLRVVAVHQPAVFVMENVKGILSSKIQKENSSERVFAQIRRDLNAPWDALQDDPLLSELKQFCKGRRRKYRLYSFVTEAGEGEVADSEFLIRCEEYGIPQARHRVVLLGVREDLHGQPGVLGRSARVRVRDVIGGMPALRSGLSKEEDSSKSWLEALQQCFPRRFLSGFEDGPISRTISKAIDRKFTRLNRGSRFIKSLAPAVDHSAVLRRWLTDRRLDGVLQHESRSHMNSDLGRYLFAAASAAQSGHSPRIPDWPVFLLPSHRNVDRYRSGRAASGGVFVDRFKVQVGDRPSSTITSHIAKDGHYFIHPDPLQCRSLTVREAARLQTFPDNYFFCGNRTQQYHQVGNAVPPFLALQMAEVVAEFLASNRASESIQRSVKLESQGALGS